MIAEAPGTVSTLELSPDQRREAELAYLEQQALLEELTIRGVLPPPSFLDTIADLNRGLLRHEHIRVLADVGQRLTDGVITRLLVLAPPRYWKSEVFSRLLPAHFLRNPPADILVPPSVGLITHSHSLSTELSEEARDNFVLAGGTLKAGVEAKSRWATSRGGKMWASGTDGRFLGKGYHLGIIDDPVDPEQVNSPVYQRRFQRFFPGKFLSRQEPRARIAVVMQRLGVDDPVDFLLRREVGERTDLAPQYWHVVVLDEVRLDTPLGRWDGPRGLPPTCTLEPDWRASGEVLAPLRFTAEEVSRMRTEAGPLVTAAQRDQRPSIPEGDFWQKGWFRTYKTLPPDAYDGGKDWDTAYTENQANSASGYVESFRGPGPDESFPIYIHDVDWDWKDFPALVEWMKAVPGPHYIEAKASGKSASQSLQKLGVAASEVTVLGGKLARSSTAQPVVSTRRVHIRQEIFEKILSGAQQGLLNVTAEALNESIGALDVNDMFVQAIWRHMRFAGKAKKEGWFT